MGLKNMSNEERVKITLEGAAGVSAVGLRPKDEDFIIGQKIVTNSGNSLEIAVVLDGMGGGVAGERASESAGSAFIEACSVMSEDMHTSTSFEERANSWDLCIIAANRAVESVAKNEGGRSGTTFTGIILMRSDEGKIMWSDLVHVGDTRAYLEKDGQVSLLSEDHSMTGEMVRAGYIELHQIEETHGRNVLTMSLGGPDELKPMIKEIELTSEDNVILCCDGVWGPLHTIEGLWIPEVDDAFEKCQKMVDEALERGSTDNCSILIWSL